jgi:RHS repeat-associated protein
VPGSTCAPERKENWPDVPWGASCATATCPDRYAPTFWSTKRLAKITTQVRRDSGFTDVDSWAFEHLFPKAGDGEKPALWLKSITHTGLVGGSVALPSVTFEGSALPNRVDKADGVAPLLRYRVTGIISESGGLTTVTYAPPNCVAGSSMPANPESNTLRCFPVRWAKEDHAVRTDYFHKYVVESVTQSDRISDTGEVTSYEYLDGAAWHYDDSEFVKDEHRTWNEFRGFGRVRVRTGKAGDVSGPVGLTESRFYRGMDGDRLPNNGTRSVTVSASEGGPKQDHDWLQGQPLETITYQQDGSDTVVSKTITEPTWQGPTATRGRYRAYLVREGATQTYTALAAGGWRVTRTESRYDDRGLLTQTNDLGDTSTPDDDRCTRVTFARNDGRWLLNFPVRTETVAVRCDATPTFPADAISDIQLWYDGQQAGVPPTVGNVTLSRVAAARPAAGPVYETVARTTYDDHGRVEESSDALGRVNKVTYTPDTGGPVTQIVTTNAAGHVVTTTVEPAWGQPTRVKDANGRVTETAYDPLGRTAEVWLPNRSRSEQKGNSVFSYEISRDGSTVLTTSTIGPNGRYTTRKKVHDGLLRLRQTQQPAPGGGRLITEVEYDSQGRPFKTTQPYFNDAPIDNQLWVASDVNVPGLTVTEFDGVGRPTARIFKSGGKERWRTTTSYGGDRTHSTPPSGGTATTTISDARGQTTELRQYRGGKPEGEYDATRYAYTPAGALATLTDPAGNVWRYEYDLQGRQTKSTDPDKGITTVRYDAAGQLIARTDARATTLAFTYDDLGRKTSTRLGSSTGPALAAWTYDTAPGGIGLPASATRYVDGNAYKSEIAGYSSLYQPLGRSIVIPEAEQTLAGTYTTSTRFRPDGSLNSRLYPAIGGLPAETVLHTYDDLALPAATSGGFNGLTAEYATATKHTRYGELARVYLGKAGKQAWLSYYYEKDTRRLNRTIVDAEVSRPMQTDTHYAYDPAGNITSIADTPKELPADVQCFRYDHLRRLTAAWTPNDDCQAEPSTSSLAGPAPYWQEFGYDKVGNRLSETLHAATGDTVRTYSYPAAGAPMPHALTSVETVGPAGSQREEFRYDASGNTTVRGGEQLDWDAEGHLAKVTDNDKVTEFVYDADGNRLIRRDPTGSTLYLDGQELRLDKATGKLSPSRYYEHGGKVVALRSLTGLVWLASDHQNTQQVAINADTMEVVRRRQAPFGAPRGAGAAFPGEKGFVGGTVDSSTGLTHLGAREYDPVLGRFISVDPILDPGNPQQLNAYAYSYNSPITTSDPTGLVGCPGPDGIGCGSRASKEGYDMGSDAGRAQYERDRKRWLDDHRRKQASGGAQASQGGQSIRFWHKCPDGEKGCRSAAGAHQAQKIKQKEQYDEAQRIKQKSVVDVAVEAGGEILMEFLGINDIKSCFKDGDIGSCISMVIGIIPWSKLARVGELLGAVKRAWNAVSEFRKRQKWADEVLAAGEADCIVVCGTTINGDVRAKVVVMNGGTINGNVYGNVVQMNGAAINGSVNGNVVQVGGRNVIGGVDRVANSVAGDVYGNVIQAGSISGPITFY